MMDSSLRILDAANRGIPNIEHIVIRVERDFYIQNQWVGIGIRQPNDTIFPLNDNSLWLGTGWVNQGDWIFVYTGKGSPRTNPIPNQDNKIYTVHWNRERTLFSSPEIHPYLLDGGIYLPPSFQPRDRLGELLGANSPPEHGEPEA